MKSKGVAYLLWLIGSFGILGLHRIYLNKWGTGILWIITGGLCGIGAFIDLFTLSGMVDVYNAREEQKQLQNEIRSYILMRNEDAYLHS